ncbi:Uncharacterised protein [Orientia tsutsugamushi str. Gilliam]|uniref:Uncharacterized protein n=1 Tax=Orientia tsutsugamushi str. Gilliam TaxID=1359184 RepID=A0A2U3R6Z4_ORITS|nr:Uncharacterised protein [Orientia tsutsugamushi str. Gilliam]
MQSIVKTFTVNSCRIIKNYDCNNAAVFYRFVENFSLAE